MPECSSKSIFLPGKNPQLMKFWLWKSFVVFHKKFPSSYFGVFKNCLWKIRIHFKDLHHLVSHSFIQISGKNTAQYRCYHFHFSTNKCSFWKNRKKRAQEENPSSSHIMTTLILPLPASLGFLSLLPIAIQEIRYNCQFLV